MYSIPKFLEDFFKVDDWSKSKILEPMLSHSNFLVNSHFLDSKNSSRSSYLAKQKLTLPKQYKSFLEKDLDNLQLEILESICSMTSHVQIAPSSKKLMKLRASHPHYFRIRKLFELSLQIMSSFKLRFSSRRFIFGLFDVRLTEFFSPTGISDLDNEDF
ncbi:Protein pianissimo A [Smittium culicis]|uniref:Protein pianissimo A n=1 Tax=Smittium culicis TaxID=133412 RepID=A0A1R1YKG8_9FUNG|nr:Protein pianissimo A [Smittium culicis]